jgi:hypothetical protein
MPAFRAQWESNSPTESMNAGKTRRIGTGASNAWRTNGGHRWHHLENVSGTESGRKAED